MKARVPVERQIHLVKQMRCKTMCGIVLLRGLLSGLMRLSECITHAQRVYQCNFFLSCIA